MELYDASPKMKNSQGSERDVLVQRLNNDTKFLLNTYMDAF